MAENIAQVYVANPITTIGNTDLLYVGQGGVSDAAIAGADLIAQFGGGGGSVTPQDIQNQTFVHASTTTSSPNVYALTLSPALTSYQDGQIICFQADTTNTNVIGESPATINVNGLGAVPLCVNSLDSASPTPLFAGAIQANCTYEAVYSSATSVYVVLNPSNVVTGDLLVLQSWNYAVDSGGLNSIVINIPSFVTITGSLVDGAKVSFKADNNNTGATTLDVNGTGANPIVLPGNVALTGGEIVTNNIYECVYNSSYSAWILLNSSLSGVNAAQVQSNAFNYGIDSGIADAYDVAVSPAITSPYPGMLLCFIPSTGSLSGGSTIKLNGGTPLFVYNYNGTPNAPGDFAGGVPALCMADAAGTSWQLINPIATGKWPQYTTQGVFNYYADAGIAADVYVANAAGFNSAQPSCAPIEGTVVNIKIANTNTGASTLNFNGAGAMPITYKGGALVAGDLVAGQISQMVSDGTNWQLINSQN